MATSLTLREKRVFVVVGLLAASVTVNCGDAPSTTLSPTEKFSVAAQPLVGTNTLTASRDTTLLGGVFQNLNFGTLPFLLVEKALVGFDQNALTAISPSGMTVSAARLDVTILGNPVGSGRARTIQLFRLTHDWSEEQATFRCAVDRNVWNLAANCPAGQDWLIGAPSSGKSNPWAATPTATALLRARAGGVLSFDVSADVRAFAAGTVPNFGWVIKSDDLDGGTLILGSREASTPPRLVVTTGCASGFADCNGQPGDGCEQRLNTPTSCGGCGISCDDSNPCTADACSADGVCTHTSVEDGLACDDGNACTRADSCRDGACVGSQPVACAAADQCHGAGSCDPATGACSNPPVADGTACNDGDACTQTDSCLTGVCTGSNPVTCVAADQCHVAGACDPSSGVCTNPPATDGVACNDGNACTQSDRCLAGTCSAGEPVVCPTADGCHPGLCDSVSGTCSNPMACHLYGVGTIPSATSDGLAVSPLTLEDGASNNQVGGIGSAIAYTGVGNLFLASPDRGPNAGDDSFTERYYVVDLALADGHVTPTIKAGAVLDQGAGLPAFTGRNIAFDATNSPASRRLDVEGLRVGAGGTFFVSDEYGPFVYEFAADGHRLRALNVPAKFLIDHPAKEDDELPPTNTKGRQSNRGMEGLAISPDGSKLYGLMQSPLIQDGALSKKNNRVGTNLRLLEIDVVSGQTREFLYPIASDNLGTNEILAVNDHQFLVDERDGKGGTDTTVKKLYLIDISAATDISNIAALPSTDIPAGVSPVSKQLFLDLLDPAFGLAGATFPEKIEGLAFGPDLPDGRHTLVVSSDNDFLSDQDSKMFVFAIDRLALPGFTPQQAAFSDLCDGLQPVTCGAPAVCHRAGMCNPGTGTCNAPVEPVGKPVGAQVAGDCRRSQCDGQGNAVNAVDISDVPVDGNQCTSDACTADGLPANPPMAAGTTCAQGGGTLCDGAGACVSCLSASDCGVDTECTAYTCQAGACGIAFAPAGTPLATQVAGDCHVNQCDGVGGVVTVASDTDVPTDDGNPCTLESCSAGTPTILAATVGVACGGAGVCDGAGSCLGCLTASDCPGADTECARRVCAAGQCQMAAAPAGTPVVAQTSGDCRRNVCDGTGQTTVVADDSDLPVDNNQCTADTCSNGVPSNAALATGASCAQNGGQVCDGNGACVSQTFRVLRVGDGAAGLSSAAAALFIEERRLDGSLVGTIPLPVAASGANQPFTQSGSASSEGGLSLSGDGRYLITAGYAAVPGTAAVAGLATSVVKRTVARIDAAGNVDTSTTLATAFNANNVRGATSADGTGFWVGGAGGATGGVWFVPIGTSGGVQVTSTLNNVRWLHVIGGKLYGTSNVAGTANVFIVGTGLPTLVGQTAKALAGMPTNNNPSPFSFALFDLAPGGDPLTDGMDTLYVADDRAAGATTGGVQKWTWTGATWAQTATLNVTPTPIGFRGLAGSAVGGKVTLVASTADNNNNRLVVFVDDAGAVTSTIIASASANTTF
ncbi:MAG TPA: esterase-like activity of phytase family protein, partial [Polyangia bacterium]|nr:esterase-like activity of phytase family protein [Polyangia bacterium]